MQPTRHHPGHRRTVRGEGVDLSVVEVGPVDAPAVVIAHGVGSSARFVLDAFADAVVSVGSRLVAYDLRGHGRSGHARDPADHALERHAADLAAVVDAVQARVVGGISLGAHAAAELAATRIVNGCDHGATAAPHDRGLEGVIACLPAWTGQAVAGQGPHAAIADEIRTVGLERALARATSDPAVAGWLRALLRRDWSAADPASLEAALVALDGARGPDRRSLGSITVPVGVVGWPGDPGHPIAVARDWQRWAPRAALERVTMDAVGDRPAALGRAALRALGRARG